MEIFIVIILLGILLLFALGGALWVWAGVLAAAFIVGFRAYRVRCPNCGEKVISGWQMRFCNQCGMEQPGRGVRFRCRSCRGITRSELRLRYCNRCGASLSGARHRS